MARVSCLLEMGVAHFSCRLGTDQRHDSGQSAGSERGGSAARHGLGGGVLLPQVENYPSDQTEVNAEVHIGIFSVWATGSSYDWTAE